MVPVTHHFTEQQIDQLKAESQRTGLSVAEIIRRAIDAWLDKDVKTQSREDAGLSIAEIIRRSIDAWNREHA